MSPDLNNLVDIYEDAKSDVIKEKSNWDETNGKIDQLGHEIEDIKKFIRYF